MTTVEKILQNIYKRLVDLVSIFSSGTSVLGQVTINTSGTETFTASVETTSGTVATGKSSITFTTNSTFTGSILGVARTASTTYSFYPNNPSKTLAAIPYVVTTGSVIIDVAV